MDYITRGTLRLITRLDTILDFSTVAAALAGTLESINFAELNRKLSQNDELQRLTRAWLGEVDDRSFAAEQIGLILGSEKLEIFAVQLGLDKTKATAALADVLSEIALEYSDSNSSEDQSDPGETDAASNGISI